MSIVPSSVNSFGEAQEDQAQVTSTGPCYNDRPEFRLCHSNGDLIGVPSQTSAASWAVINAFKSILDSVQLVINGWLMTSATYPPRYESKRAAGRATAVRLINYWTFGTDRAELGAEETRSNIRNTMWDWEESQWEVPDFGDRYIGKIKYYRNCRALDEAISAQNWLESRIVKGVGDTIKTEVDIQHVGIYLEKEYELLSNSLKRGHLSKTGSARFVEEINTTVIEPLRKTAAEFMSKTGFDPTVATLVKSRWIDSFDQALKQADQKSEAGITA